MIYAISGSQKPNRVFVMVGHVDGLEDVGMEVGAVLRGRQVLVRSRPGRLRIRDLGYQHLGRESGNPDMKVS